MELVAHHLQIEAVSRPTAYEKDLFGRSSYNRYYYATFLSVREMLGKLDSTKWLRTPHANVPGILSGTVKETLKKERLKAQKIGDAELVTLCNRAVAACDSLAGLMKEGSAVRVTADYYPEIPIDFTDSPRFKLNSIDITAAHDWPLRARVLCTTITAAWAQVNA